MAVLIDPNDDPYGPFIRAELGLPFTFHEICKMLEVEPLTLLFHFMLDVGEEPQITQSGCRLPDGSIFVGNRQYSKFFSAHEVREMLFEMGWLKRLSAQYREGSIGKWMEVREMYLDAWRKKWEAVKQSKSNL